MTTPLERAAQLRARAAQIEALEKEKERKKETQRKIILGGLIVKAGLSDWTHEEVYGALLAIAERGKSEGARSAFASRSRELGAGVKVGPSAHGEAA